MIKKSYLFLTLLTAFLWLGAGNVWGEELKIGTNSTYTTNSPVWGNKANNFVMSQIIYPASSLTALEGKQITKLTFYTRSSYASNVVWNNMNVRITERDATSTFASTTDWEDISAITPLYTGQLNATGSTMEITLSEPYVYYGGNLVIDIRNSAKTNASSSGKPRFQASTASNSVLYDYNSSSSTPTNYTELNNKRPDVMFTYEDAPATGGCPKPKSLTKSDDTPDGATFTWEQNTDETTYQWACVTSGTAVTSWTTLAENVRTKTISGLTAGTAYDFHVRSYCGDGENEQSASVKINFTPTCPAPTYPTTPVTNKKHNSATVTWNAAEGISKYQYVCVAQGTTPVWTGVEAKAVTYVDLSGLAELTNYDFYVRSWYSETAQSAAQKTSFQTSADCSAKTIDAEHPWTENFTNQTTNAMPLCWTAAGYDGAVYVASSSSYITFSYGKALYFTGSGNAYAYAILPDFTNDLNTLQITFSHVEESSTKSGQIQFGYYKDATFTPLHTCAYSTSSSAWRDEAAIVITGVPTGAKLAFGYKPNQSSYTAAVDNISISLYEAPACVAPTALAVSEIGTNCAKVTWNSEATDFALEYKKTSDAEWTAATGDIASGYVLSGLAANETEYTVRVQAICGETPSDWVELDQPFETKCQANTIGWSEDFDGLSALPACWAAGAYGTGNGQWTITSNAARFNARTNSNVDLTTPEITLSEAAQLQFTHSNTMATGSVYVKEGDNDPVLLANIATTSSAKLEKINLTDYTGTVKIIFRGHGYNAYTSTYFYLEDVTVIAKPCAVPAITAADATSTGAVVTWTAGDDEGQWNLQYREIAEPENSWNLVEDVTTGYEITGLTVGHNYEVQVQAYCDATHQSAWTASANFSPVCGAAPTNLTVSARTAEGATLTWEGAENAFLLQTSSDGETWADAIEVNDHTYDLTGLNAGATYYARVQNACGGDFVSTSFTTWCDSKLSLPTNLTSFSAIPACWEESPAGAIQIANSKLCFVGEGERFLYLPQTSINLNLLSVTFTFGGSLEFGYIDEPNGAFHAFASQPTSGVELDLADEAAAAKYIAIRYNGANSWASASISAISIRKTPTCLKPTAVVATPGVGSAFISWTNGGSEEAWNLQYKLATADDWTEIAISEKPYNLSGLEQGFSYKVRVQAACVNDDPSDWSDEASFITDCEGVAMPWNADFSQALSACWTIYAQDETYYKPAANTYSQDLQISGGKDGASNNVVVLPAFAASLSDAMMTFEYRGSEGASYAQLKVGYMNDKDDAASFVALETLEQAGSYTEARVALNAVPAGKYLAFCYAGGASQGDQYIKNLRVANTAVLADNANNATALTTITGQTLDVVIGRTMVAASYYNTLCLPFDLPTLDGTPLEGGDLWEFKYAVVENEELLFRIVEASSIEAGKPYFIAFPNNSENIVNPLFQNVTISATVGQEVGNDVAKLCAIVDQPVVFTPNDQTKLFLAANNTLYWWKGSENSQLNSFRAYFKVATGSGANNAPRHGMPARIIKGEQVATGIEDVRGEVQSLKVLENNQVVIIRNGVKYTIQGQVIQ
jgi:hypothetical protein